MGRDKVECGTELVFAGMLLKAGPGGLKVTPDPSRIQAIRDYPAPTDLESLRRFLGLAEQFHDFMPDLAASTSTLRGLLKKKNLWLWKTAHQEEFDTLIKVLSSPSNLSCLDPKLASFLITNASCLGLGFIFYQLRADGTKALIQ